MLLPSSVKMLGRFSSLSLRHCRGHVPEGNLVIYIFFALLLFLFFLRFFLRFVFDFSMSEFSVFDFGFSDFLILRIYSAALVDNPKMMRLRETGTATRLNEEGWLQDKSVGAACERGPQRLEQQ